MILRNPHVQTLWGPRFRRLPQVDRREEKLLLSDGDHVWLSWAGPVPEDGRPIVLLLHGLAGCHDSHYIRGLQRALNERAITSVAMNARGALRPNDRARTYHAGEKEDIADVLAHLHRLDDTAPVLAAGFSLGGSRLLNYLADQPHPALCAAVTVCVPLLLDECANRVDQGFSRVYRNHLISQLVEKLQTKLVHLQQINPAEADKLRALGDLSQLRSFWEFDEQVMAPLHGFASARDYYDRCSAQPQLAGITVDTLLIQADDDPFMTPAVIPDPFQLGRAMTLEVRPGGHVGFIDGSLLRPRYWLEQRLLDYWQPWLETAG